MKDIMEQEVFDIHKFDEYMEDNRREVKNATVGLPNSLWDTYSAFANCRGGVIILGVGERHDGSWYVAGLQKRDVNKLLKNFWSTIHDTKKVSINLLSDENVETYRYQNGWVIVIRVPMAPRQNRPVYLNNDIFGYTYRRNHEGDFKCTRQQVKAMLRDQTDETMDMAILEDIPMEYLNMETVHGYRNRHNSIKTGHPFERLSDDEFLRSIGAAAISQQDGKYHPTGAGLLMFGDEYNIVQQYPEYFLDYREILDPTIRWTDRLQSSSGEWSGNVCDFYFRVYNKIIKEVKVPFKMVGGTRIDDTPIHKALREALANCLMNADFYEPRGVVIKLEDHKLTLENPGYIRVGKEQYILGGVSDPRNKGLMKMFNLIDIGERAGSGVPDILNAWADEGLVRPEIHESFGPGRTTLILSFEKKQTIKTNDKKQTIKTNDKGRTSKTQNHIDEIVAYLDRKGDAKTVDIAEAIGVSPERTRVILANMAEVEPMGGNRNRTYRLKQKEDTE